MTLLALDPGTTETAWCRFHDGRPLAWAKVANEAVAELLRLSEPGPVAIEMVASYGMPVGREVFETVLWIGRFAQIAEDRGCTVTLVYRQDVKLHLCRSPKANDATIRQALVDRYGGSEVAITGRRCPACKGRGKVGLGKKRTDCAPCSGSGWAVPRGPLYGIAADIWSALALAVTSWERGAPCPA